MAQCTVETRILLANEVADLPTGASAGPIVYYDRALGGEQSTTSHGDTYSVAWDRDGKLYCMVDDTKGFDRDLAAIAPGNTKAGRNLTVNLLLGTPGQSDFRGHAIFGEHLALAQFGGENEADTSLPLGGIWKATGLGSYDGVIYLVVHDQTRNFPDRKCRATGSSIIKSVDGGTNWITPEGTTNAKPASFIFQDPRFSRIAFVQYGADGRTPGDPHDSDVFVYAIANDGDWDNGSNVYLGRVRRSELPRLRADDWEFFTGLADGEPQWGLLSDTQPVFTKSGHVSQTTMYYCPSRRCYILPNWYYVRDPTLNPADDKWYGLASSGNTAWEFFAAPAPWGPWHPERPFFTKEWTGEGYYNPSIVNKYSEGDVLSILCGANYWSYFYGLHYLDLRLK